MVGMFVCGMGRMCMRVFVYVGVDSVYCYGVVFGLVCFIIRVIFILRRKDGRVLCYWFIFFRVNIRNKFCG